MIVKAEPATIGREVLLTFCKRIGGGCIDWCNNARIKNLLMEAAQSSKGSAGPLDSLLLMFRSGSPLQYVNATQ